MTNALTTKDKKRLRVLEATIGNGLQTFLEVGDALREIRDSGLHIETHDSFEKYVSERWEMSRSRAYQYIDAAEKSVVLSTIVDTVPEISQVTTESQIREFVAVPDKNVEEVAERAAVIANDAEKPITAKIIRQARKEVVGDTPPQNGKPITNGKPEKPELTREENADLTRKLAKDLIDRAVRAVDDYAQFRPSRTKADIVKLLQKAGADLW